MIPVPRAGGCIRLYSSGPVWHVNSSHTTFGFEGDPYINPTTGHLTVEMERPFLPVIAPVVLPDETLVARRIMTGVSGGVSACNIQFSDPDGPLDLRNPADYAKVTGSSANLWLTLFSAAPEPEPELEPEPETEPEPDPCRVTYDAFDAFVGSITRHDLDRLGLRLRAGLDVGGCGGGRSCRRQCPPQVDPPGDDSEPSSPGEESSAADGSSAGEESSDAESSPSEGSSPSVEAPSSPDGDESPTCSS